MLPFFNIAYLVPQFSAATPPAPVSQEIVEAQEVRSLPGKLDNTPVFNSNSPELVLQEGILLSTFPGKGKANPSAHLNYPLQGNFDVFAHHVAKAQPADNLRTLYIGILLKNPGPQPITLKYRQAASYLSQPDAPFIAMNSQVENPLGDVYAGPGSRAMSDILRDRRQSLFSAQITIPPGGSAMLMNLPIPVKGLTPPINGRSTYMRLTSSGKVYVASLAMFAPTSGQGERAPTLQEWQDLLDKGALSTPRDRTPTPPNSDKGIIYGRVAGISIGSRWQANLTDPGKNYLSPPATGKSISWGISTLTGGQLGTGQIQSATMAARYPDTAYQAHGNYGVQYSLKMPLYNSSNQARTVTVALQTPIKQDSLNGGLRFLNPLPKNVHFRGTVRIQYPDGQGVNQTKFYHLVQKRGEQGSPLATITIPARTKRTVQVDLLYPPDATPPQVLTIKAM
jgi:Protein of unknown function (DUF3370)